MEFEDTGIPLDAAWSSAFSRWQGPASEVDSLTLAERGAAAGLTRSAIEWPVEQIVLGMTIPQKSSFYGAPTLAARLGFSDVSGPMIAQACATSVACLHAGAASLRPGSSVTLVVTTDRVSNSPQIIYPSPSAQGGAPVLEHWTLDNFKADPWGGTSMLQTAENVAQEAGFAREELDELAVLRYEQYEKALANDFEFQRRYMVPIEVGSKKRPETLSADWGVRPTTTEGLTSLAPGSPDGVVTFGTQTHPADGTAGFVVTRPSVARELGARGGFIHILATGFSRVGRAQMPKAPVPAAFAALADAGLTFADVDLVQTHNPFAVNDLWFARETGWSLEAMNPFGCSLIYGHPQGPTGARGIIELAHALALKGGGIGLFTGCAAGDTGGAVVIRVDD